MQTAGQAGDLGAWRGRGGAGLERAQLDIYKHRGIKL